jgi:hypothetical protein
VSGFGSIRDASLEPLLSSWEILSLSFGCLSIRTNCLSVAFETVGYKTTCFAIKISFRDRIILGNAYGKARMQKMQVYKCKLFRDGRASINEDRRCE